VGDNIYIQSPRPRKSGNPEGISKECGKGGKPALWLSMLSHFHGLFCTATWMHELRHLIQCAALVKNAYRDRLSMSASAICRQVITEPAAKAAFGFQQAGLHWVERESNESLWSPE
jgi:hypothetical protein